MGNVRLLAFDSAVLPGLGEAVAGNGLTHLLGQSDCHRAWMRHCECGLGTSNDSGREQERMAARGQ